MNIWKSIHKNVYFNALRNIRALLDLDQKKRAVPMILLLFVNAFFDLLGLFTIGILIQSALQGDAITGEVYTREMANSDGEFWFTNGLRWLYQEMDFVNEMQLLFFLSIVIFVVFIAKNVAALFINYLQARYSFNIALRLSMKMFQYYYDQGYLFISNANSGNRLNAINNIPAAFSGTYLMNVFAFSTDLVILIFIGGGLLSVDPLAVALITVAVVPTFLGIYQFSKNQAKQMGYIRNRNTKEGLTLINEGMQAYTDVKLSNKEEIILGKYEHNRRVYNKAVERPDPWGEPDPAGPGATEEVVVRHGAELDIELRVPIRGGLGVTILEGGRPLAGALVKLEPVDEEAGQAWWWGGQEDPRSRISDHAGRARFSGLEVGAWWLLVSHPARRMVAAREVRVERSPRELRIELGVATIEARLVDAEGEPVEGVDVRVVTAGDERLDRVMNDYRMRLSEDQDGYPSYDYEEVAPPRVRSDDEGRFRLRGVAPEVPLRVQLTGTYVVRREVEVGPLGPDERWGPEEIQVERAGALRVRLEGVDRERLGSYRARLRGADGAVEERRFRSWRGEARFDSLPPGPWTLELHEKGIEEPLDTREVEVRAARTERVALRP